MKPATTMLVGVVALAAVFLAEIYVAAIVFLASCAILVLILAGTLIPIRLHACRLVIPAAGPGSFIPEWPCLENTNLDPYRDQDLRFHIEATGFRVLGVIGIGALYLIQLVTIRHGNPFRPYREVGESGDYVLFYVLAFASMVPVGMAASWLFERIRLARSSMAVGSFDPQTGGYTFCDQHGSRHGGTRKPITKKPHDNICVVFYAPNNPESNISSAGLWFHRLRLQTFSASAE